MIDDNKYYYHLREQRCTTTHGVSAGTAIILYIIYITQGERPGRYNFTLVYGVDGVVYSRIGL